jgi:hypothetical protein
MTKVTLPRLNQSGVNEFSDVQSNDEAIANVVNGELDHTNLSASAEISRTQLASEARPVRWYTPKVIATEESRTNTEFGFLTTEDKIENVVLPENGLITISYRTIIKSSVAAAGRVALFLGSNQIKNAQGNAVVEQATETSFSTANTSQNGFTLNGFTEDVTSGQIAVNGAWEVYAAAGTYTVGAKYKATSGSVTAKNRKLWVRVLG